MPEIAEESVLRATIAADTATVPLVSTAPLVRRFIARAWWLVCLLPAAVLVGVAVASR